MASWLIIPVIVICTVGLGSVVVLQFLPGRAWFSLNGLFASITLGVVLGGWLGLILAELNRFSPATLLAVWLIVFFILLMLAVFRKEQVAERCEQEAGSAIEASKANTLEKQIVPIVFVLWMIAMAWLFFRPHEYILGGADAGVYVSLGAEISQNGGFTIQDETLAALDPALRELFLRPLTKNPVASYYLFPGFYVTDAAAGSVVPQFYPLHPTWQAAAFSLSSSAVEGVRAELLLSGLWMLLASVAIVLTARELGAWPAGLLMMVALGLMALQVWFARYPTTEALTQFLLWSGLWGMVRWLGEKKPLSLWAFLAGASLGAVFLVRIDILVLLPLFGLFMIGLWLRGWQRDDWWFAVPFSLLVIHSFYHGAVFSAPYFSEHIGFGLRLLWKNWWLTLPILIGGLLGLWFVSKNRHRYQGLQDSRPIFISVLIGVFLVYAIYGWFIRPVILDPKLRPDLYSESLLLITNHENWWRLGWYLSVVGVWLGVAGICLLIWRLERKTVMLVAVGVLFSILYLWNVRANPHQIYVMRRFVPVVAPFFLLAAALLISQLPGYLSRTRLNRLASIAITCVVAVIWLGSLAWSAKGFVQQIDNRGVLQQLAVINEEIPAGSILLFNDQSPVGLGDFWGTPLNYIFGHDSFTIRDSDTLKDAPLAETIEFWQNNGRSVIWIGDPQWLNEQGVSYTATTYTISSRVLEGSYEHKPREVIEREWKLPAAFLDSNPQSES